MNVQSIYEYMLQQDEGAEYVSLFDLQGMSRPTDFTMDQQIPINMGQLQIKRTFYHKQVGIVIEMCENIVDQTVQQFLEPEEQDKKKKLILLPQNKLYQKLPTSQAKILCFNSLQLPINPQLQNKLCFIEKSQGRDYMLFFEDLTYNKGSVEHTLQSGNVIDLGFQAQDDHLGSSNQSHYVDLISNFDAQNKLSFCRIDLEPLDEHTRRPIIQFFLKQSDNLNNQKRLESSNVQINEPYIISIVNQVTLNVYSIIDPKQIYTLKLEKHFEFFLEITDDEIMIGQDKYYKHQTVLFQVLDLKSNSHRIQALILPSLSQMAVQSLQFKLITLPYKYHMLSDQFRRDDGLIQQIQMSSDDVVVAHFLQLREPNHYKDNMIEDKSSTVIYNQVKYQSQLLIQLRSSIVLYDFIMDGGIGQVLAENCDSEHRIIRVKDLFGKMREHVCDLKVSVKPEESHNTERLKDIVGDPKFFYFLSSQDGIKQINLLHINYPELLSTEQLLPLTIPILEFQLSTLDIEQNSLIILDENFCISTFTPSYSKLSYLSLVLKRSSSPILLAQNQWIQLKAQDAKIQCNVKRHIKITDLGIYIDDKYFRSDRTIQDEFEDKREKIVSNKLKGGKDDQLVYLNESGVVDSGTARINVYTYRKIKQLVSNMNQLANRAARIMLSKKSSVAAAQINKIASQLPQAQQMPACFYFLVIPEITSTSKNLLPSDSFGLKELEFSSFIGDDILLKCGGTFIVFNIYGSLVPISLHPIDSNNSFNCSEYRVIQLIQCNEIDQNTFKLLMVHQKNQMFAVATITKHENQEYRLRFDMAGEPFMPRTEDRSITLIRYISVLKLNQRGELIRMFLIKKVEQMQHNKQRGASIQLFRRLTLKPPLNTQDQQENQIIVYIEDERQEAIEQRIKNIIEQDFHLVEKHQNKGQPAKKYNKKKVTIAESLQTDHHLKMSMVRFSSTNNPLLRSMNGQDGDEELQLKDNLVENITEDQVQYEIEFKESDFDFQSIDDGFVVQIKNNLYKVDNDQQSKLNITLKSQDGLITQILPVQQLNHIQFMYYDNSTKNFHLFTWNLQTNEEKNMYVFKQNSHNPFYFISRGVQVNDNYLFFIGQDSYQDLRLNFQSNQFSGQNLWPKSLQYNPKRTNEERMNYIQVSIKMIADCVKISNESKKCLGIMKGPGLAEIHRTYSLIDLQYIQYLRWKFSNKQNNAVDSKKEQQKVEIELEHIRIMFPSGRNLLHYFATEIEFLKLFLSQISDSDKKKKYKDFIYYPLHPSSVELQISNSVKARRPLSLALKTNASKAFELLIQILQSQVIQDGHQSAYLCIIDHLRPYLQNLLIWKSNNVRSLVASRCHQYLFTIKVEGEKFKNQDIFVEMPTMYIDENRVKELSQSGVINIKKQKSNEPQQQKIINQLKSFKTQNFGLTIKQVQSIQNLEIESDDDKFTGITIKSQNKRQTFIYAYDFSGLLQGPKAEQFLRFLINQKENLSIFELRYIQALLNYRWNAIRKPYFFVLILIIIKTILMICYILSQSFLIDCYQSNANSGLEQEYNCSQSIHLRMREYNYWDNVNFYIIIGVLVLQIYITHKEMNKFLNIRTFSQALVLFFNYLHIIKILADYLLLTIFQEVVIDFTLQRDFSSDTFNNIDKRYQDRYALFFIFVIKFGNALLLVTLPLIFFFKIRFQLFITVSLPRFFLTVQKVLQLIFIFSAIYVCLYYSYTIMDTMRYLLGDLQEDTIKTDSLKYVEGFVRIMKIFNTIFRTLMFSLISMIVIVMFHFLGTTISRVDSQSTNNVELEKYRNLASLLLEDTSLLKTQSSSSSKKTPRYVIQAQVEQSQTLTKGDKKKHGKRTNDQIGASAGAINSNEEFIKVVKEMLAEERKEIAKMINALENK